MLPRLRFVIAAIVIAMLPMAIFSMAPFHVPYDASDPVRRPNGPGLAPADVHGAQQLQALGYARRADELSRLRELASQPLAAWVASPAGDPPGPSDSSGIPPVAMLPDPAEAAPTPVAAEPAAAAEVEPAAGDPAAAEPHRPGGEPSSLLEYHAALTGPVPLPRPSPFLKESDDPVPLPRRSPLSRESDQRVPLPRPSPLVMSDSQAEVILPLPRPKPRPARRVRVAATPAKVEPSPFQALFGLTTPAPAAPASH